jgi:AcrR family transcriptional regulator
VLKRTLYNYFPGKESILAHRFHAELAEYLRNAITEYEPYLVALLVCAPFCIDWRRRRNATGGTWVPICPTA